MIVRARSPYIIFINKAGQTSGKLELRIWKKGETKPTLPTYSFTKSIPSATQTLLRFNISPYLKDFISNKLNDVNTWYCNFECRLFSNNVELTAQKVEGIAVNGYTSYVDGMNYTIAENDFTPMFNPSIKRQLNKKIGSILHLFKINNLGYYERLTNSGGAIIGVDIKYFTDFDNIKGLYNVELFGQYCNINDNDDALQLVIINEETCEPILEPQLVQFVNRYGGLDFIWFFKMRTDSISTESKDYKLLQPVNSYDTTIGQNAKYNFNGKQSIKMNTGFVNENYNELIQDLMLSEKVWINSIPAIVKSTGTEFKTQIRNKNINYEIEFEYAFDLINNMQ
jgi:hypothetical protein